MSTAEQARDPRRVFVVHGRDRRARDSVFDLLRAFGLKPIEWSEAVGSTGNAMPSIIEVLMSGFSMPAAVVVLLTPDDRGILKRQFQDAKTDPDYEHKLTGQARLNVVFEAGIACALLPKSTILLERGRPRPFTDISGLDAIRIDARQEWKSELARRLKTAGCELDENDAWLKVGGFDVSLEDRWNQYEADGRKFGDLLDREELDEAKRSDSPLSSELRAYCLISSIQEAHEMAYWVQVNRSSRRAGLLLTEFLLNSPLEHGRPRFRAARALELFDDDVRDEAFSAAEAVGGPALLDVNAGLLAAARSRSVEEYTRDTPHVKNEASRALLLTEYMSLPRNGTVRLVDFD